MSTSLEWMKPRPPRRGDTLTPRETVLADIPCHACGRNAQVKINRNRIAYVYCPHTDESGEPCSGHYKWGRSASNRIISTWAKQKEADDHAEADTAGGELNAVEEPEPELEQDRAGDGPAQEPGDEQLDPSEGDDTGEPRDAHQRPGKRRLGLGGFSGG